MNAARKPVAYKPTDELFLWPVVNAWQKHYAECGVTRGDIELYAEQIDRPFLLEQRREFTA